MSERNCFGYYFGEDPDAPKIMEAYAQRRGLGLDELCVDRDRSFSGLRSFTNLVKLGSCGTALFMSTDERGLDKYIAEDLLKFLSRSGVKVETVLVCDTDRRHELAEHIARYVSADPLIDICRGEDVSRSFAEIGSFFEPPFGYRISRTGMPLIFDDEAEIVRRVFVLYAAGMVTAAICDQINGGLKGSFVRFGADTVEGILGEKLYLGMDIGGRRFPPIITLRQWFAVYERIDRENGTERSLVPFFGNLRSTRPVSFVPRSRYMGGLIRTGDVNVDAESLEAEICRVVRETASKANARLFYEDYMIPERNEARNAAYEAASACSMNADDFRNALWEAQRGNASAAVQKKLGYYSDLRTIYSRRLERIKSERELFSIGLDEVESFFERASALETLSRREQSYLSEAFILEIRLKDDRAAALLRDPLNGGVIVRELRNVLVDDSELIVKR